jgi:hypothetical protein
MDSRIRALYVWIRDCLDISKSLNAKLFYQKNKYIKIKLTLALRKCDIILSFSRRFEFKTIYELGNDLSRVLFVRNFKANEIQHWTFGAIYYQNNGEFNEFFTYQSKPKIRI